MQRLEQLITMARKLSGNSRYDDDSGVPQDVFVQHFNDAQDALTKNVVNLKTKFFKKTLEVPVVPGQAVYPWPSDCYIRALETLQWSNTRSGVYYQNLQKLVTKEKVTNQTGYPFGYIPENAGIEVVPPINNGTLYLTYEKVIPRLQKRAGTVTAVTTTLGQITALTVATTAPYDEAQINDDYYLCVVDKFGVVKAKNILYTSVSGGVFTLSPFTLGAGESVSVGDSILVGDNTCNVPEWPNICESYLRKYVVYQAKYGDSSKWSQEAKQDMIAEFDLLSTSFAMLSEDITDIPMTSLDYVGF